MSPTLEHLILIAEYATEHGIPLCPTCGDFHHPNELHTTEG